jgi:hypothetical protein
VAQAVSDCGGDLMMLAAVRVDDAGSPLANLSLLAWATKADVMFNTGASDVTHLANGAEWYFSANWSWGFAPGGATVERDSCDLAADGDVHAVDASTPYRLCWHTGGGNMNGGWRVGGDIFQNLEPTGYLKYIYTAQSSPSVPEPSGIALAAIALAGCAGAAPCAKALPLSKQGPCGAFVVNKWVGSEEG